MTDPKPVTDPQPCWWIPEDKAHAELAAAPGLRWPEATTTTTVDGPAFYPPADRGAQWFGGTYPGSPLGPVVGKIVLHTTETGSWPGYAGGASAPNLTYHPTLHKWRQHFRLDRSARALRDPDYTLVRENRVAVQCEIVCTSDAAFAKKYGYPHVTQLDDRALRDLAAFLAFMNNHWGTPLTPASIWLPYPSSYGDTTARMSGPTYDAYRGILGHQHVSGNSHGDPGSINIGRIIAYAKGTTPDPPPEDPDMAFTDTQATQLADVHRVLLTGDHFDKLMAAAARIDSAVSRLDDIERKIDALAALHEEPPPLPLELPSSKQASEESG